MAINRSFSGAKTIPPRGGFNLLKKDFLIIKDIPIIPTYDEQPIYDFYYACFCFQLYDRRVSHTKHTTGDRCNLYLLK